MIVRDLMTPSPLTISDTATLREALEKLYQLDIRHLPVIRAGKLVGIISDRDLKEYALPLSLEQSGLDEYSSTLDSAVSNLMHSDLVTVNEDAEVAEVIDLLVENKLSAIPVVNKDEEHLVGIVSYVDIINAAKPLFG